MYWSANKNVARGLQELHPVFPLGAVAQYCWLSIPGDFTEHKGHKYWESTPFNSAFAMWKQPQTICKQWTLCIPIKSHLWAGKLGFHIIFIGHTIFFFFDYFPQNHFLKKVYFAYIVKSRDQKCLPCCVLTNTNCVTIRWWRYSTFSFL